MIMAVCSRCVLPTGFGGVVNNFSTHSLSLRAPKLHAARRTGSATSRTLSTKKYKFEEMKVYDNNCDGILWYRSGDGEVICEGYDEGPKFCPTPGQRQEEQYRKDAELYSIIPGIILYLVEGIDYTCMGGSHKGREPFLRGNMKIDI